MRSIDADALRKNMEFICMGIMAGTESYNAPLTEIDNAPSIPLPDFKEGYKQAIIDGKTNFSRAQNKWGKWIISEIQCPNCFNYFDTDCYSMGELKKCPVCDAKLIGEEESE